MLLAADWAMSIRLHPARVARWRFIVVAAAAGAGASQRQKSAAAIGLRWLPRGIGNGRPSSGKRRHFVARSDRDHVGRFVVAISPAGAATALIC